MDGMKTMIKEEVNVFRRMVREENARAAQGARNPQYVDKLFEMIHS